MAHRQRVESCIDWRAIFSDYFQLFNDYYRMSSSTSYNDVCTPAITYGFMTERRTPASKCLECGECEKVCPQHLPIMELLREKISGELWSRNPDSMLQAKTDEMEIPDVQ